MCDPENSTRGEECVRLPGKGAMMSHAFKCRIGSSFQHVEPFCPCKRCRAAENCRLGSNVTTAHNVKSCLLFPASFLGPSRGRTAMFLLLVMAALLQCIAEGSLIGGEF